MAVRSLLAVPLLPVSLALRALDDLHALAGAAAELPEIEARLARRVDDLEERMAELLAAADGGRAELRAAVRAARRLDGRAASAVTTLGGLDGQAEAVVAEVKAFQARVGDVLDVLSRLEVIAAQVAAEGGRVAEALPALERAITSTETLATVVEPLHGATERLGRIVDRLPGQRSGGAAE